MILKSEKGVTLISLLTYIAVLLTVLIIIVRITGIFNRNLNSVDSANKASSDFSLLNYSILSEVKRDKATADVGRMTGGVVSDYVFSKNDNVNESGNAIKFGDGNVIGYINGRIYFNKTKIVDDVSNFKVTYHRATDLSTEKASISVEVKIGEKEYKQDYTFR